MPVGWDSVPTVFMFGRSEATESGRSESCHQLVESSRPADNRFPTTARRPTGRLFRTLVEMRFSGGKELFVLGVPGVGIRPSRDIANQLTQPPIGIPSAQFVNAFQQSSPLRSVHGSTSFT